MIKLEFDNGQRRRVISTVDSINNAFDEIDKFLDEKKYKSYYKRIIPIFIEGTKYKEYELEIDVGSYTEFFYISGFTPEEYEIWKGSTKCGG